MGMTLAQKILARASGRASVTTGEIVEAEADWHALVDLGWYMVIPVFKQLGAPLRYPDRMTVHLDHKGPADTIQIAELQQTWRDWCSKYGVTHLQDLGRGGGISHQVLLEKGYAAPGRLLVHQDTHANTCGAVGCYATALGVDIATDMVLGFNWHRVPETIRVSIYGSRPSWLLARDIAQNIVGELGPIGGLDAVLEFDGPVVDEMSMDDRFTLCNWSRKVEAVTGMVNPDDRTLDYVTNRAIGAFEPLRSDSDATYAKTYRFDVSTMEPVVAVPPHVTDTQPISMVAGTKINQAFVGSCAGGKLEDIRAAADVVRGKRVADGVRFIVTPASNEVWRSASQEGLWDVLSDAGAIVTTSTCGACYGGGNGVLGDGEVCIASSTENNAGRMGSLKAHIYLASPATVAASAIAGSIQDPRGVAHNGS